MNLSRNLINYSQTNARCVNKRLNTRKRFEVYVVYVNNLFLVSQRKREERSNKRMEQKYHPAGTFFLINTFELQSHTDSQQLPARTRELI